MNFAMKVSRAVPSLALAGLMATLASSLALAEVKQRTYPSMMPQGVQKQQTLDAPKRTPSVVVKSQACYKACLGRPTVYGCPPFGGAVPKTAIQACCKNACGS